MKEHIVRLFESPQNKSFLLSKIDLKKGSLSGPNQKKTYKVSAYLAIEGQYQPLNYTITATSGEKALQALHLLAKQLTQSFNRKEEFDKAFQKGSVIDFTVKIKEESGQFTECPSCFQDAKGQNPKGSINLANLHYIPQIFAHYKQYFPALSEEQIPSQERYLGTSPAETGAIGRLSDKAQTLEKRAAALLGNPVKDRTLPSEKKEERAFVKKLPTFIAKRLKKKISLNEIRDEIQKLTATLANIRQELTNLFQKTSTSQPLLSVSFNKKSPASPALPIPSLSSATSSSNTSPSSAPSSPPTKDAKVTVSQNEALNTNNLKKLMIQVDEISKKQLPSLEGNLEYFERNFS